MMRQDSAVAVFAGARDDYQLAMALQEVNLLRAFVTNWYSAQRAIARYGVSLGGTPIKIVPQALIAAGLMRLWPGLKLNYYADRVLGRIARTLAYRSGAALFSYSYYAYEGFKPGPNRPSRRFIFQIHPHPKAVRRILLEELELTPAARASLQHEAELSLSEAAFNELAEEPHLANGWVVASQYTAESLVEYGIERQQIHVVPYGLNFANFPVRTTSPTASQPFTIIFLGSLIQRKGLSYLLDAARLLKSKHIRILLRGRGFVDEALLEQYDDLAINVELGLSAEQVIHDLQSSDLFVLPSLVEGFAHVVLQAMGCGLPVITTPHTCGPDVLNDGEQGFIVPIRDAVALAEKIQWGIDHRAQLAAMGQAAATTARAFTWKRFREGIQDAYLSMLVNVQN